MRSAGIAPPKAAETVPVKARNQQLILFYYKSTSSLWNALRIIFPTQYLVEHIESYYGRTFTPQTV
jgi:hypothetical protein